MTGWFVPGRLEVLGKHTDYAGGRSLLAVVDRGIQIELTDGATDTIIASSDTSLDQVNIQPGVANGLPRGHWGHYLQTVIDRLANNFWAPRPAKLTISSNLPLASGMSSSSALIVATTLALVDHNGYAETDLWRQQIVNQTDLAGYLAVIENGLSFGKLAGQQGVGTLGGCEDHTAMIICKENRLSQVSFCPIALEDELLFPTDHSFVVLVSGVLAEKTGAALGAYNRASLATKELVARWNQYAKTQFPTLADALDSDSEVTHQLRQLVADENYLIRRLQAFECESNQLIPAANSALVRGDLAKLGEIAWASHENASKVLGNQIVETDTLVHLAEDLGALGATSFGAGFGGSVWALLPTKDANDFAATWLDRYLQAFPKYTKTAQVLLTRPGKPAHRY